MFTFVSIEKQKSENEKQGLFLMINVCQNLFQTKIEPFSI